MEQLSITEFTPKWGDHDLLDLIQGSREELNMPLTGEGGQVLAIDEHGERVDGGPVHYWDNDNSMKVDTLRKLLSDYPEATHLVVEGQGYVKDDEWDDEPQPSGEWWEIEIYRTPEQLKP